MTAPYDYHLNFEALHKSTENLESLLNQHRKNDEDVECVYQTLKKLFNLIKTDQLKEVVSSNLEAGYIMGERGLKSKYPDLANAYSTFSLDIHGWTDNPNNKKIDKRIELALEKARAKRDAEKVNQ